VRGAIYNAPPADVTMKPPTVFLGELTNPELEAFLETRHTVIVPVGATEQHGPHGPLSTDVLIPQEVARRVAPRVGAVVAPPLAYALSYPPRSWRSSKICARHSPRSASSASSS
jgi:creatinine amidohydrolase/Fe(II)-dependent formamide hydrolase-like protein